MRYCDWCEIHPAAEQPDLAMEQVIVGISASSRVCKDCYQRLQAACFHLVGRRVVGRYLEQAP